MYTIFGLKKLCKKKTKGTSSIELLLFAITMVLIGYISVEIYRFSKSYIHIKRDVIKDQKHRMKKKIAKIRKKILEEEEDQDEMYR